MIGSLPEWVKQKANLWDYNIQSRISSCLKSKFGFILCTQSICAVFLQLTSPDMKKECSHGFNDVCYSIAWRIRYLIEPRWTVLGCCNVMYQVFLCLPAQHRKCSDRKHRQHEADLLSKGRLWKGESRIQHETNKHVMTSQTCQDKVKRWVKADFVKVSRHVSTFCFDANLDHSIDSASLNNSNELHIRNFQLQTCVRQRQSLKCLYLICRFQNCGYQNLAYFRNVLLCKYKRSQKK